MIKKILFIASIFVASIASAQTFQLMDHNDVSIDNTSHYEYGTAAYLEGTKFHVKNLSSGPATYSCKVYSITHSTTSDLQVCYGTTCFTADELIMSVQTNSGSVAIPGGGIDTSLKVAPFTFIWGAADSAKWRVTVFDVSNPNDSSSAIVTWKEGFPLSIKNEISKESVSFSVYPNPASDNLTINYNISANITSASVDVFDVVGKRVLTHKLMGAKGIVKVDVSNLNSGIYFYAINADGQTLKTERVIIK
jgi:hypothetical protein